MSRFLVLLLFLASCRGGRKEDRPPRPLRDFRGIIHCHSHFSHDSKGRYEEILAAAKAADVDFVIMTDHPPKGDRGRPLREGWRGMHDGVLFIQGAEYAGRNLLALGIREPAGGDTPEEKIASIQAQGGVAIVSHPEEVEEWAPYAKADGMEIYNVHAAFKKKMKEKGFVGKALRLLKDHPELTFSLLHEVDLKVLERWDAWALGRRVVGIAGNDAHQNVNLLGLQLDPYERNFKFVSTHVLAEELTEKSVLEALRRGRCFVEFGNHSAPVLAMRRRSEAKKEYLDVFTAAGSVGAPRITLLRDGVWGEGREDNGVTRFELRVPGVYRVTYCSAFYASPTALSNHLYFPARP